MTEEIARKYIAIWLLGILVKNNWTTSDLERLSGVKRAQISRAKDRLNTLGMEDILSIAKASNTELPPMLPFIASKKEKTEREYQALVSKLRDGRLKAL